MKKLSVLLTVFVLAACSSSEPTKTGEATSAKSDEGDYATVKISLEGDKVTSISMDETKGGKSKKELGADYGMKSTSEKTGIGKEWNEQVNFLVDYIVKNGLDAVKLTAEGKASENDVLAGCTINIKNMMYTANKAADTATESK